MRVYQFRHLGLVGSRGASLREDRQSTATSGGCQRYNIAFIAIRKEVLSAVKQVHPFPPRSRPLRGA